MKENNISWNDGQPFQALLIIQDISLSKAVRFNVVVFVIVENAKKYVSLILSNVSSFHMFPNFDISADKLKVYN